MIPRPDVTTERGRGAQFQWQGRQTRGLQRALLCLFAAVLSAGPARAQVPDQPLLRMLFFEEIRAYPFARIPPGALQAARRQMVARWPGIFSRTPGADAALDANNGTNVWKPIGPAPINGGWSGRISTIAVHPTNPSTIYIGGAQGGVWKTTDGGVSWVALTDRECSLAMGSIAIDPVNPEIIYAGTGELHFSGDSYYGCGVLRSGDGGATWTHLGASVFDSNTGGARISKVIVDPGTAGSLTSTTIFVSSSVGVWVSRNSGLDWSRLLDGTATDLVMHPTNPAILYAAIGVVAGNPANGVYRTTNGGQTWTRLTDGFASTNVGRIALAIAPGNPNTLYAAIQDAFGNGGSDGRLLGIWKTTNGGDLWVKAGASNAECGSQCWYDLVIATDPANADIVYFGGVLLYRSIDGGATFANILGGIHVDQHAIAFDPFDPATVYVGNDGGIYRSPDRGTTWASLNTNLAITQFYSGISLHPTDPSLALGGTQDNGTLEFFGTERWNQVLGGDGGFTAIDFNNPDIAYAETQWSVNSGFSGPRKRTAPGFFTDLKTNGINNGDRALFIPPLVMDPTDPNVLYFGTYRVYRTANGADQWTLISGDLSRTPNGRISAIAPAASDPATIYVGATDGMLNVTRNTGASWDARISGLPDRVITDIAVDPTDPAHAIAVVSGFGSGHVFRTTNFGVSWTDISGDLPDVPVNAVIMHPALANDVYIGTDLGTFRTTLGTGTWTPLTDGLPNVAVFDLAYNPCTAMVVAGTHGRGMFSFLPVTVAALVVDPDEHAFDALQDTVRLTAKAFDANGVERTAGCIVWSSLDPDIATVDANGLLRSRGNGQTRIVAAYAGRADTVAVTVAQVPVAIAGVPNQLAIIVGERVTLDARVVDRLDHTVEGAPISFASTNNAAASVDADGVITGGAVGNTIIHVTAGALRDSAETSVHEPSITAITGAAAAGPDGGSSTAGARLPLLRLNLDVDGIEGVEVHRLTFDLSGDDADARLLLLEDADGDGAPGPNDPIVTSTRAALAPGAVTRVQLTPNGYAIPADGATTLLVALEMGGRAPNGTVFQATFVPGETATVNARSRAANRFTLPGQPLASGPVRTTLLANGQLLSFSENPVRSGRVIFNFAEAPAVAGVFTLNGRRVIDLTNRIAGGVRVEWDLTNEEGTRIAPGVYLIVFRIGGSVMRERLFVLTPGSEPQPTPEGGTSERAPHAHPSVQPHSAGRS